MKVILLGFLLAAVIPVTVFAQEHTAPSNITTEQYQILRAFFTKKTTAIGRLTAELAKPWEHSNIPSWLDALVLARQNRFYEQRKSLALKAFLSAGFGGVCAYVCVSDQASKPEIKLGAAAGALVGAAYSLNTVYEYCSLHFPAQEIVVKELEQLTLNNTDVAWQMDLLQEIAGKYPLMISKK